ncbi:hypothetical protein ACWDYH_38440 [Nocardia goodfellowii]
MDGFGLSHGAPVSRAKFVGSLEAVWSEIRRRHPDVPDVIVVIGSGSVDTASLRLGRFTPGEWQHGDTSLHELFIAGEGFSAGPRYVLGTVLHQAAHALAHQRGISDTSRNGSYHNQRYAALARELGLSVVQDRVSGWSQTSVPDSTARSFQPHLDDLGAITGTFRVIEPAPTSSKGYAPRNGRSLACACTPPRRLRAAQQTIDAGPIRCAACRSEFRPTT